MEIIGKFKNVNITKNFCSLSAEELGDTLINKIEIDETTPHGLTSLHFAAKSLNYNICQILLEKGSDPNKKDMFGWSPYRVIVHYSDPECECCANKNIPEHCDNNINELFLKYNASI